MLSESSAAVGVHRQRGRALVLVRSGMTFDVADALLDGGIVHARGVRRRGGARGAWTYRLAEDRLWPISALQELRWIEEAT